LRGYEVMNMIRKAKFRSRKGDILGQVEYARKFLELLRERELIVISSVLTKFLQHNHGLYS